MAKKELNSSIMSGLFWRFGERIFAQGVSFVISLILARLLAPNDYGVVAILLIFIDLANVFVVSSFGVALVQKKDADQLDFSSVFYFNIALSIIIYLVLYTCSPFIETFYAIEGLASLLRLLSLKIILSGVNSIQQAYVQKHMMFKKFFFSTLVGTLISAVVGIVMAYKGYGPLALVCQYLTNSLIDTLVLWFTVKWRPIKAFSMQRLIPLIQYGWKILVAGLLGTFYTNLRSFVIGKVYTTDDLAYYNQGQKFPQLLVTNLNTAIDSVLLPAMSQVQNNPHELKVLIRRSIRYASLLMWPLMMGLLSVSKNVVIILLTEKWLPCLPFMWLACLQFALEPVQTANLQAIKAVGRSDIILKLELIKKGYGILILLLTMKYGVFAIALGGVTQTFVATLCNTSPNRKLLGYHYREQIHDLLPSVLMSLVMALIVLGVGLLPIAPLLLLIIQIIVGIVIYTVLVYIFQRSMFIFVLDKVKQFLHRS